MKLNKFKYVVVGAFFAVGGMTTSCDTLDIDNLKTYDESMVWHDANLASAYVNNLYAECFTNIDGYALVFGNYHRDRFFL